MTREEKLQKAHQLFDNRNLLTELKWQRAYFERGYVSNREELFNIWIFDECIKALEQAPRWIPVSERLPEKMGTYLVTLDYKEHGTGVTALWFHNAEIGWDLRVADVVVAWMPLPEAYAESEEEE